MLGDLTLALRSMENAEPNRKAFTSHDPGPLASNLDNVFAYPSDGVPRLQSLESSDLLLCWLLLHDARAIL